MKSVRKLIETIVVVLIIIVALFLLGFELFGEHIIKTAIETAGTKTLDVGVNIDDLNLSIYRGRVEIKGLAVNNPAGYEQDHLLEMGEGRVKVKMKSLMSDTVEIESILLDGISLAIEQKGLDNNLKTVLQSLPKTEAGKPKEPADAKPGKELIVKDLKITNTTVKVKLLPVGGVTGQADTVILELDPIEMQNLGSEEPLTTAKLTSIIVVAISNSVAKQGSDVLPSTVINSIEGGLSNIKLVGEAAIEEGKKLMESGEQTIEGLKGIFNKEENTE